MQRGECLFDWRLRVEAVNLVEVNIVCAQPAQAVVNGVHDMFARKPFLVGVVTHGKEHFGCNHQLVARWPKVFQGAPQNLLTGADGIHVRGVKEIDAGFERLFDKRAALFLFQHPLAPLCCAVGHAAQTDARDFYAGRAKVGIFHLRLSSTRS